MVGQQLTDRRRSRRRPSRGTATGILALTFAGLAAVASGERSHGAEPALIAHTSAADFRKGSFGNSAANLYVSSRGAVEVVNRWDLNQDGYPDLVFGADHNMRMWVDALVYWGSATGPRSLLPDRAAELPQATLLFRELPSRQAGVTRLPAFGSGRSAAADLNNDGHSDLVFCNYTDFPERRAARIYWGSDEGFSATRFTELPTLRAPDVKAADLNADGLTDLVFANFGVDPEPGEYGSFPDESWVYWGHPDGFSPSRRTALPVAGAVGVETGDLNGDGAPDLAFAHSREGGGLRVFYADAREPERYSRKRQVQVRLKGPTGVRAADLDKDGRPEVIVTTGVVGSAVLLDEVIKAADPASNYAYVYPGKAGGPDWEHPRALPTNGGTHSAAADLNQDGWPDLAFSCIGTGGTTKVDSLVYFGGKTGFDPGRRAALPTLGATGVDAADLNRDGWPDLVFSNARDGRTHDLPSYVYWGSKTGFAPYLRTDLTSFGASNVLLHDLNQDGHADVVFTNRESGTQGGKVNSTVYWGNPHHHYSPASMTNLPTNGAYGYCAADLDADGFVDVAFADSYGDTSSVFWGGKEGLSEKSKTELPVKVAYGLCAADLNGDGHLDLVYSATPNWLRANGSLHIFWGDGRRFAGGRRTELPLKTSGSLMCSVADLNGDGFLEVLASDHGYGKTHIFRGSAEGYSADRCEVRQTPTGQLKLADLDGDGVLDWLFSGSVDLKTRSRETTTQTFRGRPDGSYDPKPLSTLRHFTADELAIADLNRDGHLDVVINNVLSNTSRSLPVLVYWGDARGRHSDARRTALGSGSFSGVELLDLNGDGYREIVARNHLKEGDHSAESFVFWGGPEGFSSDRRTALPTLGPQFSRAEDAGNLYTRELSEEYLSPPLELASAARALSLTTETQTPGGSRVEFQVCAAGTREALTRAEWRGPNGTNSFYAGRGETVTLSAGARWVRYRAVFRSPQGGCWPALSAVTLEVDPK